MSMSAPPPPNPYAPWRCRTSGDTPAARSRPPSPSRPKRWSSAWCWCEAYSSQQAPLALGLMALVRALPVMLLAIAGGQIADCFDRRRVLISCFRLGALASAGLLTVAWLRAPIGWYYPFLALGAAALAIANPSRQALLPGLSHPKCSRTRPLGQLDLLYGDGHRTGGRRLSAGSLYLYSSPERGSAGLAASKLVWPAPVFALAMLCRLLGVVAIARMRYRRTNQATETISWKSVLAGIRFVWRTKLILATITLDLFAVLLGGATYLLPIFAKEILKVGSTEMGILRAADAVGAICMALILAHRPPMRRAGVTLLWAVAGFGAATSSSASRGGSGSLC